MASIKFEQAQRWYPGADVPAVPTAEPEAADTSSPGDIVVTALKRATSLQQTPLAISAVTSESLVAQGITDSQELTRTTPNLIINENANGGSRVIIRNLYAPGEPLGVAGSASRHDLGQRLHFLDLLISVHGTLLSTASRRGGCPASSWPRSRSM